MLTDRPYSRPYVHRKKQMKEQLEKGQKLVHPMECHVSFTADQSWS